MTLLLDVNEDTSGIESEEDVPPQPLQSLPRLLLHNDDEAGSEEDGSGHEDQELEAHKGTVMFLSCRTSILIG